ncbi:MAG TPA: FtsX-like permease family protein [Methanoregulaceae archaeon]|nr:ABC transporter permease [Methanolinea sp.]MDD3091416.1 FtsX-like permease family protein [Methanoregulaceae archaeon]MDD5685871.1 FtsX-like permease family protein [Methanoregulaceae archaeon]HOP66477.1 FtsX-like permease family protein [Methanoregulaceae archaeon]HPJ73599.1 FtsX-like permease family protein [Methanoregulaceae archaeon]
MLQKIRVMLFLAWRSIQRGGRAGLMLNIVIIALVFTNMLLLPSIITGAVELFNEQTVDYQTSDILISPREDDRYIADVDTLLAKINRIPGVHRASARFAMGGTLIYKGKTVSVPVTAFYPRDEVEVTLINTKMKSGTFLSSGDTGEILLGNFVAGSEDESEDFFASLGGVRVGDSITVNFENGVSREYRVKGIFQTKSYTVDYMVFLPWEEMEEIIGHENTLATEVLVKTDEGVDLDVVKMRILSFGVGEKVKTWKDVLSGLVEESIESFNIINQISMLVSLVIAVVVIFVIITIKAVHQRREIGILKAIGIDQDIVIGSYVTQVLFICLLGTILGFIISQVLMIYFNAYPLEFPDGNVVPVFEYVTMLENTALLFVASAAAGYVPAWRIARQNILDAIRGQA